MFKRKNKEEKIEKEYPVETIPEIFYGGNDPQVYRPYKIEPQEMMPKKMLGKETNKRNEKPKKTTADNVASRPLWQKITAISMLSAVVIGSISWYYLREYFGVSSPVEISQGQPTILEEPSPESEIKPEAPATSTKESSESPVVEEPASLSVAPLDFPRINQADSTDLDSDGLTDLEEELFNTDSGSWDTDEDGYYDGLEIINLYSPAGSAPGRLIDSGLVQEYTNNNLKYRFYYPIDWEVGQVDTEGKQLLVSSITGDFIELRVFELNTGQLFTSWFAQNAKGEKFLDLKNYVNRFKENGYKREDGLVAYFVTDKLVFTIIYHPGSLDEIPYRHVMEMLVASFRPEQTSVQIPEQEILSQPTTNTNNNLEGQTTETLPADETASTAT